MKYGTNKTSSSDSATYQREHYARQKREDPEGLKEINRRYARDFREKLRADIFAAYGKRCACCGEQEPAFLTLDHVNGDGAEHRRKLGKAWYAEVRRRGFPKEFQLLCFNCNCGRERSPDKRCPHQAKCQTVSV